MPRLSMNTNMNSNMHTNMHISIPNKTHNKSVMVNPNIDSNHNSLKSSDTLAKIIIKDTIDHNKEKEDKRVKKELKILGKNKEKLSYLAGHQFKEDYKETDNYNSQEARENSNLQSNSNNSQSNFNSLERKEKKVKKRIQIKNANLQILRIRKCKDHLFNKQDHVNFLESDFNTSSDHYSESYNTPSRLRMGNIILDDPTVTEK